MPNWVYNSINIDGEKAGEVLDIITKAHPLRPDGGLTFLNLIEPPEQHWPDYDTPSVSVGSEHSKNPYNWYDWNINNWGTKWDACDVTWEQGSDHFHIRFDTAWSPPDPIIKAIIGLCVERQLVFSYHFEEEQGWGGTVDVDATGEGKTTWWDIPPYDEDTMEQGERVIEEGTLDDWVIDTEIEAAVSKIQRDLIKEHFGTN